MLIYVTLTIAGYCKAMKQPNNNTSKKKNKFFDFCFYINKIAETSFLNYTS